MILFSLWFVLGSFNLMFFRFWINSFLLIDTLIQKNENNFYCKIFCFWTYRTRVDEILDIKIIVPMFGKKMG